MIIFPLPYTKRWVRNKLNPGNSCSACECGATIFILLQQHISIQKAQSALSVIARIPLPSAVFAPRATRLEVCVRDMKRARGLILCAINNSWPAMPKPILKVDSQYYFWEIHTHRDWVRARRYQECAAGVAAPAAGAAARKYRDRERWRAGLPGRTSRMWSEREPTPSACVFICVSECIYGERKSWFAPIIGVGVRQTRFTPQLQNSKWRAWHQR